MSTLAGTSDSLVMREQDFEQIRKKVYEFCGVDLRGKHVLVGTRLGSKVRALGFDSFKSYTQHVCASPESEAFTAMIDALTTNHTSFFREPQHFEFLRQTILPGLTESASIRVWSAACSSGEEPYTIAFSLVEALGAAAFKKSTILATDISTRVLEKARQGRYPAERLQGMAPELLRDCLLRGTGAMAGQCLVKPELRNLIRFEKFNLLEDCSNKGPFDVIFCRNVMIYCDLPTQEAVVNRLAMCLAPGGYLLIGHSESLSGVEHPLEYIRPATYRRGGGAKLQRSSNRARSA
jgi:chemotaxis protein methyltransferase CheR